MILKNNPIGIYEKAIPNRFDWEDKIKIAKTAGFEFIEMSIDESDERLSRLDWTKKQRNTLKKILKKHDMKILSMCLSGHRRYPFGSHDEAKRQKAYTIIDQAIELANDLDIKNIQLAGYDVYYEESDQGTLDRFEEGLRYCAKKAAENNIMLTIEIMDTYLMGTISRALKYIKMIDSDYLKLYPDLGNLTQWTDDPAGELELGFKHIEAIHLKDTKPGVFKCVPFGQGTVNFEELFYTLRNLNYDKPFLIEMWADNEANQSFDETVSNILKAKNWLENRM